jgi:hypothetical protein
MHCKNCSTPLISEINFCTFCGAKVIRNRLTLKNIFEDFSEQFLNYDNKFLQTFIALFSKPEAVIGSYIAGTRKKYVNVLSYFAIAITFSGLQIYFLNKFFPEAMDLSSITAENTHEIANNNLAFLKEYQSILMMAYVPLYALLAQLVFLRIKKFNYAEHLVMFMFILAQLSILGAVISVVNGVIGITIGTTSMILLPIQVLYSAYCLKKLYQLSFKGILLRTLLFFLILLIFAIVFTILFTIAMVLYYGGLEEFVASQKAVSYIASSVINWTS